MAKLRFDRLVTETSERLYGLSSLIDLIDEAHPKVWEQAQEALKGRAKSEDWDHGDYSVQAEFLEADFTYSLPKEEAYSVIVLLSSIVETQILGYAARVATQKGCDFNPKGFRTAVLKRVAAYVKDVAGSDLTQDKRWELLNDLQTLRNVIVHRAGIPDEGDERDRIDQIRRRHPGLSLNENPFSWWHDAEIGLTIPYCRYFAREVEAFFKSLFEEANLPVGSGLWPNIQSGFE